MIFLRKNKPIVVKCYSSEPRLPEFFPVDYTKSFLPEWYKKLPAYLEPGHKSTMKICPGIREYFNQGFTIPLWSDHSISWKDGELTELLSPRNTQSFPGGPHPNYQWGESFPGWAHVKLVNPWFFSTDEMIPFLVLDAVWNKNDLSDYVIPQGIVEFKYQHSAHVQLFLSPNKNNLEMKAGEPLVNIIPLTEREIKLEICEMTQEIYNKIVKNYHWTWDNLYYKTRKLLEGKSK